MKTKNITLSEKFQKFNRKINIEILSNLYITYTIFNYNTISLRCSFFPVPGKGLYLIKEPPNTEDEVAKAYNRLDDMIDERRYEISVPIISPQFPTSFPTLWLTIAAIIILT
jgi:hypothetical protein